MANTFRLHTFDGSSTGADTDMVLYTVGSGVTGVIIGLTLANITGNAITADVILVSSTSHDDGAGSNFTNSTVFVAKNVSIPGNASLEIMTGNKIIMQVGDIIKVQSNTANSMDSSLSFMEIT
jgi:hypothetical protein